MCIGDRAMLLGMLLFGGLGLHIIIIVVYLYPVHGHYSAIACDYVVANCQFNLQMLL